MRYLRYAFLAILAVCLITVALANRDDVTLRLLPTELANLFGLTGTTTLPLFLVIFGGIVAGILIGFVWEWFREFKQRADAAAMKRENQRLLKEVARLRVAEPEPELQDDVLALLEAKG